MDWLNNTQLLLLLLGFLVAATGIYLSICYFLKRQFFKEQPQFYRTVFFFWGVILAATIALSVRYPMGFQRVGGWQTSEKQIQITAWERYWWSPEDRVIDFLYDKSNGNLRVRLGSESIKQSEVFAYTAVPSEIVKRMSESFVPTRTYEDEIQGRYDEQSLAK